jgi:guanine nucleotide-binding protein G(I)/G(S)/G(T) subunit beta-1
LIYFSFLANGLAFGSASDDSTCRLWDVRAFRELAKFAVNGNSNPASGLAFSSSGRYMFTVYNDINCVVWDTLRGDICGELKGHTQRITSIGLSTDGCALATGSWDNSIRVSYHYISFYFVSFRFF